MAGKAIEMAVPEFDQTFDVIVIGYGFTIAGLNAEQQRTVASNDTLELLGVT